MQILTFTYLLKALFKHWNGSLGTGEWFQQGHHSVFARLLLWNRTLRCRFLLLQQLKSIKYKIMLGNKFSIERVSQNEFLSNLISKQPNWIIRTHLAADMSSIKRSRNTLRITLKSSKQTWNDCSRIEKDRNERTKGQWRQGRRRSAESWTWPNSESSPNDFLYVLEPLLIQKYQEMTKRTWH